ncbi:hypothetical protein Q1695_016314 [Nippostrongylus brasiliensis]|nr:hypothetical protein Q1695_016314 [Nippostrongylus brasiliensis]
MNKLQAFHNIFIVLAVTATVSPSATSGPVCVLISPTTTTPSPRKPLSQQKKQEKCDENPAWIHAVFAKHHASTDLRMNCYYNKEALWAADFYMGKGKHSVNKDYWCQIEHYENTWKRWFHEDGINTYLTLYFDEKINRMAKTYPGTEYGCTAMWRNGYFFNLNIFLLCIYSRQYVNGTVAPCPS